MAWPPTASVAAPSGADRHRPLEVDDAEQEQQDDQEPRDPEDPQQQRNHLSLLSGV
jgi:hypothetical protein